MSSPLPKGKNKKIGWATAEDAEDGDEDNALGFVKKDSQSRQSSQHSKKPPRSSVSPQSSSPNLQASSHSPPRSAKLQGVTFAALSLSPQQRTQYIAEINAIAPKPISIGIPRDSECQGNPFKLASQIFKEKGKFI